MKEETKDKMHSLVRDLSELISMITYERNRSMKLHRVWRNAVYYRQMLRDAIDESVSEV